MSDFPRTNVEELSVSRMLIGTNWLLGYSHQSTAKDKFIKALQTRENIAAILEVFFRTGVDTLFGARPDAPQLEEAIRDAEDRTGVGCIRMGTPHFDLSGSPGADDANRREIEAFAAIGCRVCLPHMCTTDTLIDRRTRTIREMDRYAAMIREAGMIPGLSTHTPEAVLYADETDLDVGTYTQIYNAAGFLMHVEVDWTHNVIWKAKKPVVTIKPLAAGRLHPLVGLTFSWATLRERDMVAVGCLTSGEARECIDISLSQLYHGGAPVGELPFTRSKASLVGE
jgi:hypothetical protein